MSRSTFLYAGLLFTCLSLAAGAEPPIRLEEMLGARRPHPLELAAAEQLAAAERQLAAAGGWWPAGTALQVSAGRRRGAEGAVDADGALGIEVPWVRLQPLRRSLAESLERAHRVLPAAAAAAARLEVERVYLQAWSADAMLELRERELRWVEEWRALTRRRVDGGAEPPYSLALAAGEHETALAAREAAAEQVALARAALAGHLALPLPEGRRLATPFAEAAGAAVPAGQPVSQGCAGHGDPPDLLAEAIGLETELELLGAALAARRESGGWSVVGELAGEGEEAVARLGFAYRLTAGRERRGVEAELRSLEATRRREAELRLAELGARRGAARLRLATPPPAWDAVAAADAMRALAARLEEGRDHPAEVLAQRRFLIEAGLAAIERQHARALAAAELRALEPRPAP